MRQSQSLTWGREGQRQCYPRYRSAPLITSLHPLKHDGGMCDKRTAVGKAYMLPASRLMNTEPGMENACGHGAPPAMSFGPTRPPGCDVLAVQGVPSTIMQMAHEGVT